MKRLLLLLFVSFSHLLVYRCSAQVGEYRSALAIGLNGGYALDKVSFSPTVKQNFHGGLTGGLTLRYTCERYYSLLCALQLEVNYAQMGWRELIETSQDTYSRTINYVQLPLLARLGLGREVGGVMGYLVLGPQLGLYLSDSEKRGGEWSSATLALRPNHVVEQYDLAVQNKFEYGITGGLGLEVNTRHAGHFMIEGRYYFGLSNIFHDGKSDPFGRSANGAIVAKASYLFDIFHKK
ncbi:MAG: PorT family protein [Bacteroidaceae bacterium]|nr:PorT family protein [Bacteroidaceae bacterium]